MSGGQMQRVALARALVNDPDILLADEPTGALDSETSIQVMDLLKEVAKDRLVVMVTHNPELAHQYATRIVSVRDGRILDDTDPYEIKETDEPIRHENMGKASMSFLTALSLSFNNLLTKKTRTLLVSFAGSIGIIGIAAILSLSNGVNTYIHQTEENALSEYPLEITGNAMRMTSMMEGHSSMLEEKEGEVKESSVISSMMSTITENDLASFKAYLDSGKSGIDDHVRAVEYKYNVEPLVYMVDEKDEIHQVNPNTMLQSSGLMPTSSIYSSMFSTSVFSALPQQDSLYKGSYDVRAGRWPENENEAVIVLSDSGRVTDMVLYSLGMKDYSEFEALIRNVSSSASEEVETEKGTYRYQDFIGIELKLVNAGDCYVKDENLNVYTDMREDDAYMKELVKQAQPLTIVGVVQSSDPSVTGVLTNGIAFSHDLIETTVKNASESEVVKAQMENPDGNVLTGEAFGKKENEGFVMEDLFSVNTDAISNAFSINPGAFVFDTSSVDLSGLNLSSMDLEKLLDGIQVDVSNIDFETLAKDVADDFVKNNSELTSQTTNMQKYLESERPQQILKDNINTILSGKMNSAQVQQSLQKLQSDLMDDYVHSSYYDPADPTSGMQAYMQSEQAASIMTSWLTSLDITFTQQDVEQIVNALNSDYTAIYGEVDTQMIQKQWDAYLESESAVKIITDDLSRMLNVDGIMNQIMNNASTQLGSAVSSGMEQLSSSLQNSLVSMMTSGMQNGFSFNADALKDAFSMNMDMSRLSNAMVSMMSATSTSYEDNLSSFGYEDLSDPSSIVIYPVDFDAKTEVKNIIDRYNDMVEAKGEEEKVILYVDAVATLMSSVTDIIDTISYVLIAFVAISLVVSSIMIGIITYISVLERQKEIGVLRAIGASKRNVSNVFNAETFITGLLAGLIGIGVTLLLLVPGNALIHALAGNTDVNAVLPVQGAIILIALSVILTMIGGIIPSNKAAKSDPVKALRTE